MYLGPVVRRHYRAGTNTLDNRLVTRTADADSVRSILLPTTSELFISDIIVLSAHGSVEAAVAPNVGNSSLARGHEMIIS